MVSLEMTVFEQLIESNHRESNWIDYKKKIDFIENKVDFLRDIVAFANNSFEGNQYIVYGVKQLDGKLELIGLDSQFDKDDAEIQQLIYENIEPVIDISFSKHIYQGKMFLLVIINADKTQRPFMFKKKYKGIDAGYALIRIGSSKRNMLRSDFESIYTHKVFPIVVNLRDREFFINNQDPGRLELIIKNPSDMQRVFNQIKLVITDEKHNIITETKMIKFLYQNNVQEGSFFSDFTLDIPAKSEISGTGDFYFSTSQAVQVGLNEYGEAPSKYIFILKFIYDIEKEYTFKFDNCRIYGKGAILRKVIGLKKQNKKYKSH